MPVTINGSSGITANDGSVFTNASGNVGIGTSNVTRRLTLNNQTASGTYIGFRQADTERWVIGPDAANRFIVFDSISTTNRIEIQTGGQVLMPAQPAFLALGIPATISSGIARFGSTAIPLNVGSNYSQSTGRFTAPIGGNYQFNILGMAQANFFRAEFRRNGSKYSEFRTNDGSVGNYMQATFCITMPLSANDYVDLNVTGGNFGGDSSEVQFSGVLVC